MTSDMHSFLFCDIKPFRTQTAVLLIIMTFCGPLPIKASKCADLLELQTSNNSPTKK